MLLSLLLLQSGAARAISVGQIDTFGDSTIQGWRMGVPTVTDSHMTNIADGGPAGAGDNFLQVVADGTAFAEPHSSRMQRVITPLRGSPRSPWT